MSHTPAPWELDETHFLHALNNNMVVVPIVDYAHAKACVNACAEFPDPKIDIGLLKLDNEQKAKLLVSCEMALTERDTEIAELKARVKELEQPLTMLQENLKAYKMGIEHEYYRTNRDIEYGKIQALERVEDEINLLLTHQNHNNEINPQSNTGHSLKKA